MENLTLAGVTFCGSFELAGEKYTTYPAEFYRPGYNLIHISRGMTGKMHGIPSISTSCVENPICKRRRKAKDSVCAHCYAVGVINRHKKAGENYAENFHILAGGVLSAIPYFFSDRFVRLESFGDVANEIHAYNYFLICKANPQTSFSIWSKNAKLFAGIFEKYGKPENLIFIESSEKLNTPKKPSFPWVDKVFTVYDKMTIKGKGVPINCAKSCAFCGKCYDRKRGEGVTEINEILK